MIFGIDLCFNHRWRVGGQKSIAFTRGLNVIVGPNGSGKSTVLRAIHECGECSREQEAGTAYRYFDAETMNPHREEEQFTGVDGSIIRVRAMFSSHGETMRDVMASFVFEPGECLLLDEPESGHDLSWIIKIRKGIDAIGKKGCQVIAASHHPVFWKNANLVELEPGYAKKSVRKLRNVL